MTAVEVRVRHNHQTSVSKLSERCVRTTMLETEDLLQIRKFLVIGELLHACVAHVPGLPPQWEYTIGVPTDDTETGDRERLGRVALGDDQGALVGFVRPGPIRIIKFRDAKNA